MRFFKCLNCDAGFSEDAMTLSDYRDGCCPYCKMDGIVEAGQEGEWDFFAPAQPHLDWDEIRRAKATLCRSCEFYDHANLGCSKWLMPSMNCQSRKASRLDTENSRRYNKERSASRKSR